jgi:hypothetical protein
MQALEAPGIRRKRMALGWANNQKAPLQQSSVLFVLAIQVHGPPELNRQGWHLNLHFFFRLYIS